MTTSHLCTLIDGRLSLHTMEIPPTQEASKGLKENT